MDNFSHLLSSLRGLLIVLAAHLQQLANIIKDPEASNNDRFVAYELLKNANVAAGMILPGNGSQNFTRKQIASRDESCH